MNKRVSLIAFFVTILACTQLLAGNPDRPMGFSPYAPVKLSNTAELDCATGETFAVGDVLTYTVGTGLAIATGGTDTAVIGVAAESCSSGTPASGSYVTVWLADGWLFRAQTSGTASESSHLFAYVDYEGSTGSMEIDEDGSNDVFFVRGLVSSPENSWGSNAELYGQFVAQSLAMIQTDDSDLGINDEGQLDVKERCISVVATGGSGDFKVPFVTPWAGTVQTTVYVVSDTATTGSDGSNYWAIDISDSAGNDMTGTDFTTNGNDFTALTPQSLTLDQNLTVTAGEGLYVFWDETGTATDLSAARVSATICIDTF